MKCTIFNASSYSSNEWYEDWNNYLRKEPSQRVQNEAIDSEIKLLASALNKHKTRVDNNYSGIVFRGTQLKEKYFLPIVESCQNGNIAIARSFFSTSLDENTALSYSKLNDEQIQSGNYHSTIFHAIVKEEPSLGEDSQFETEKEVLVLPNNIFQLVGVQIKNPSDSKAHIYMIELDQNTLKPVTENNFQLPEGTIKCKSVVIENQSVSI